METCSWATLIRRPTEEQSVLARLLLKRFSKNMHAPQRERSSVQQHLRILGGCYLAMIRDEQGKVRGLPSLPEPWEP